MRLEAPGTIPSLCSKNFLEIYKKADMIISKVQGNCDYGSVKDGLKMGCQNAKLFLGEP